MYNNEQVRKMLNKYLHENGVKATFIADRLNLNKATISMFRRGKRDLADKRLNMLLEIINN